MRSEFLFVSYNGAFINSFVFKHPDANKLMDSPTIFKKNGVWYMTYIVFDGKGYETWIAESKNLLDWKSLGKILSFSKDTWDANQKDRLRTWCLPKQTSDSILL